MTPSSTFIEPLGIEGYTPLARIGAGGQAEILLAFQHGDSGFRKLVVIKRLWPHLSADEDAQERMRREAQLVAHLRHPNVCQVLNLLTGPQGPLLVLEYLEGATMSVISAAMAKTRSVRDVRFIAAMLQDFCEGLHVAHELETAPGERANLVHRDISGNNLLVTREGIAKVLDFGIARSSLTEVTRTGVRGTTPYMSPEQVRGHALDRRSDIFSLGVVAYEALTGRRLFRRANTTETFEAILGLEPPIIGKNQPNLPAAVETVVRRSLAKDPRGRMATSRELGEAVAHALVELGGPMRSAEVAEYVRENLDTLINARHQPVARAIDATSAHRQVAGPHDGGFSETESVPIPEQWKEGTLHSLPTVELPSRDPMIEQPGTAQTQAATPGALGRSQRGAIDDHSAPLPAPPGRSKARSLLAVTAALVLVGGGVVLGIAVTRDSTVTISARPTTPAPTETRTGVANEPAIASADADVPDAGLPAPGHEGSATSEHVPAVVTRKDPARRAAVTAKPGFLTVDSRPFATIHVDGKMLGKVPLYRVPLAPGRHQVRATLDDGRAKSVTVRISSEEHLKHRFRW